MHNAKAKEMEEPRKCQRGEKPPQVPEVNDYSSVVEKICKPTNTGHIMQEGVGVSSEVRV